MVLGFKKDINGTPTHFATKILMHLGEDARAYGFEPKSLTLRDDPNNRWQPGKTIHFATGVRTKEYECFAMGKCKATALIWFQWKGGIDGSYGIKLIDPDRPGKDIYYAIWVNSIAVSPIEAVVLAMADGFDSLQEFFDFHYKARKDKNDLSWAKKIIYF